jgi:protease-4
VKSFFQAVGVLTVLGIILVFVSVWVGFGSLMKNETKVKEKAILSLELNGVIVDGKKFLKDLRKYREDDDIKGVLVQINSPGGVVGPSQEIYAELKRTREVYKKPVVVTGSGLVASGAFYSAMGADKFFVEPGTLTGSIGVIMEFANLEKLYDWAKIKRYVIKTGAYKDTGAEYREMRPDEKQLLEGTMQEVLAQFKKAIADGRKMPIERVSQYADGRIFTGETAVKLGFADQVGTFTDAVAEIGKLTKLGNKPELFEPPKDRDNILQMLISQGEDEDSKTTLKGIGVITNQLKLLGQPLFMMKGSYFE